MDGAGGAWAVKGAGFAVKPARPFKADGFKRAMARAAEGAKPAAVPAGGTAVQAARPVAARPSVAASQAAAGTAGEAAAFRARIAPGRRRGAVEGSVGRALRHQRGAGVVRNPAKAGRSVLRELAG